MGVAVVEIYAIVTIIYKSFVIIEQRISMETFSRFQVNYVFFRL